MRLRLLLCLIIGLSFVHGPAGAIELNADMATSNASLGVKSLSALRFTRMIKQQYDFSCGAAALASLLTYHYGITTDEGAVLKAMYDVGDQPKIRKVGFSMLDMQAYLKSIGLNAQGYHAPLDKILSVGVPVVALTNNKGYMHFIIIKGLTKERVLVGDPAVGSKVMSRDDFQQSWNGIAFVITDRMQEAQQTFNLKSEWGRQQSSLFSNADTVQSMSDSALNASTTPNYYR